MNDWKAVYQAFLTDLESIGAKENGSDPSCDVCSGAMRQSPTPHPSGPLSLRCSNFLETDYVSFQKYSHRR
jgi:hypothetical protein